MDGVPSAGDTADVRMPPHITLRPMDICLATERLVDCWHALRRSSMDAAVLPLSENNIFAFADMCLFMATVHDLDAVKNKTRNLKKTHNVNVPPISLEVRPSFLIGSDTIRSSANIGATGDEPWWSEGGEQESLLWNGQRAQESSPSSASAHIVPPNYNAVAPNHQGNAPASAPMVNALDNACYNAYDQAKFDMAGFTVSDDPSIMSNSEPVSSDLVGIAYLCPATGAAASACEVSMGVALLPRARRKGFGTEAVRHLLQLAFEEFKFHRVSAGVIGPSTGRPSVCGTSASPGTLTETEAALRMFVGIGFAIEGTRYRAVPDAEDNGAWRDVHYLAMLDTCWFGRPLGHPLRSGGLDNNRARAYSSLQNRRTRWDEMLARHQKEREMLINAESRLKRSASTETLRPDVGTSAKGTDVEVSLACSTNSTSSAASECTTSSGVEHDQQQGDQSPALSSSNSFSNPPTSARSEFRPRPRPHNASEDENIYEEDDLMIYLDASAVHAKVARFLLAHPAPGPPPTELGSNLDSEAESVSEFESCADLDGLDFLGDANDKGNAKETTQQKQDQEVIQLLSSNGGDPFANSDPSKISYDTPAAMVADGHSSPLALSGQARKKRRLSSDLVGEAKNTISPNVLGAAAPHLGTSTLSRTKTSPRINFISDSSQLTSEFAGQAIPTISAPLPDENPNAYSDADSEEESVLSEAETISTGMSTWDVVSSASEPHRSPSPTYSLSSGTSSLSLQDVSKNVDDRD